MIGFEYHPAAEAEYLEAVRYYSQINPELGISLVLETEKAIERARQFPEAYGKVFDRYRHVMTHRFPFQIIYEVMQDRILIWAFAHAARKPGYWKVRE